MQSPEFLIKIYIKRIGLIIICKGKMIKDKKIPKIRDSILTFLLLYLKKEHIIYTASKNVPKSKINNG